MSSAVRAFAVATTMAAAAVLTTGTAAADSAAVPVAEPSSSVSQVEDPDRPTWVRYRAYGNMYVCEAAGAGGMITGRWLDWRCDDSNTLWVLK